MEERRSVERVNPWNEETVERQAASLYGALRDGAIIRHLHMAPVALLDAVIARVHVLAREEAWGWS